MNPFEELESNVRYYCRRWPAVFSSAHGATLVDENGVEYLDFFAGAGALSYGHNNPVLVEVAIQHLREGRDVYKRQGIQWTAHLGAERRLCRSLWQ